MNDVSAGRALQMAQEQHRAGRFAEAEGFYRQILSQLPDHPGAMHSLAVLLVQRGRVDEALPLMRRVVQLKPQDAAAHSNLGQALEAIGRLDEAVAAYRRAIQLKPDLAGAFSNLGNALLDQRRLSDSIAACRRAIELQPDMAEAHNNLGNALSAAGCLDEAIAAYSQALRLNPNYVQALSNLGGTLIDSGRLDEPVNLFRRALQIDPEFPDAHWNLAIFLLLHGNFAEGLPEYEWRWKVKKVLRPPPFSQPRWDGHDLNGRTILLHAEQGFGDAIQFIRYAPMVAARGGRVIVQCPMELKRLFSQIPGIQVLAAGDPLPKFDFHCPLLSLPLAFKTDLQSIPSSAPYLSADPELVETWRGKLPTGDNRRRIGLAWAGAATHANDRNRSILPANFAPLAQVKDAVFYSLQKGDAAKSPPPAGMALIDFTSDLKDFADTAAMIENLDLVIAADTSVAHLAGAMGKPVWVLLPCNPDWRWMLHRLDSPWYPTMRLFRQKRAGEWQATIEETAAALRKGER
jgi:tetratricopeptide (TPR) repeat protein